MNIFKLSLVALFFVLVVPFIVFAQTNDILSPEERLWLENRNNTIVVYPEKGFPPYSYQTSSGIPQGLSIDYIELMEEKLGINITYLPARARSQILEDIQTGKGDVATSIASTTEREEYLYFTDEYISVSTVIVVRKDFNQKKNTNLSDFTGQKVAMGAGYAVTEFVRTNYPRIIIEAVTDDEIALQQVVLGEVDAAVMDIASLSYYLSKQVLSSVKVVGNAGYEYRLSFAVPKDKQILQSILDKGLAQISQNERKLLAEKWISIPNGEKTEFEGGTGIIKNIFNMNQIYILIISCLVIILAFMMHRRKGGNRFFRKAHDISNLKEDLQQLEEANQMLAEEMQEIQKQEERIKESLEHANK